MNTETISSYNPSTGEFLGSVPCAGEAEVVRAVETAWQAFASYKKTRFRERGKLVHALHHIMINQKDELARLVSSEVGKPVAESLMAELTALDACLYYADHTRKLLRDQAVPLNNPLLIQKRSTIVFEPLGVIGIISPWNYPLAIPVMSIVMALMCGNTVILKPSEKSPLTGIKIGELFLQAGFPPGVVSVLTGDRRTGEFLTASKLSRIIFTGSAESGIRVMTQAAKNLLPLTLELGGKDAAIVLPDAPAQWTARGLVWSAFTNSGQACASIERAYLVRGPNTMELSNNIVNLTKQLKVGPGLDPESEVGPLIDRASLTKIHELVEDAKAKGAKVACGGAIVSGTTGYFYEPTVLTNLSSDMRIMNEEIFGPVLPVSIVESLEDAIRLTNESPYGLSASIWTKNLKLAKSIARELEVGTVTVNDSIFSFGCPQAPWGGLKKSGFGRSHSYFGLLDLVNIKHVSLDTAGGYHRFWWHPYGRQRIETVRSGWDFLHHPSPIKRLSGLIRFLAGVCFGSRTRS